MKRFNHYLRRCEEEVYSKFHLVRFYFTESGLKNVGASRLIEQVSFNQCEVKELSTEQLYLGPDYLKDKHTLLDTVITESPHYEFLKTQMEGKNPMETDYMKRYILGRLDWRRGTYTPRSLRFFEDQFNAIVSLINNGDCPPVVVCEQKGRYYIYDGKHRASIYALLHMPAKCIVLNSNVINDYVWHYMFSLVENKKEYIKHTLFHQEYKLSIIKSNYAE